MQTNSAIKYIEVSIIYTWQMLQVVTKTKLQWLISNSTIKDRIDSRSKKITLNSNNNKTRCFKRRSNQGIAFSEILRWIFIIQWLLTPIGFFAITFCVLQINKAVGRKNDADKKKKKK